MLDRGRLFSRASDSSLLQASDSGDFSTESSSSLTALNSATASGPGRIRNTTAAVANMRDNGRFSARARAKT